MVRREQPFTSQSEFKILDSSELSMKEHIGRPNGGHLMNQSSNVCCSSYDHIEIMSGVRSEAANTIVKMWLMHSISFAESIYDDPYGPSS